MGMFDIECPVCGANFVGPLKTELESKKAKTWVSKHKAMLTWLDEAVIVLPTDIEATGHMFGEYDSYGRITDGKREYQAITADLDGVGYVLHQACWELAGKPSYELLDDSRIVVGPKEPFTKFAEQFFDWDGFIEKGVELEAALDPRHNKFSKDRIMELIKNIGGPYTVSKPPSPVKKVRAPTPEKKVSPKPKSTVAEKKASPKAKKGYTINPNTGREIKIGGATHTALISAGVLGALGALGASESKKPTEITMYVVIRYGNILGVFDSDEKAQRYIKKSFNATTMIGVKVESRLLNKGK